jgi:hypothetical protein
MPHRTRRTNKESNTILLLYKIAHKRADRKSIKTCFLISLYNHEYGETQAYNEEKRK